MFFFKLSIEFSFYGRAGAAFSEDRAGCFSPRMLSGSRATCATTFTNHHSRQQQLSDAEKISRRRKKVGNRYCKIQ